MELNHKYQLILTLSIVVVLFVIIIILLVPAMKGHNITKQFKEAGYNVSSVIKTLEDAKTEVSVIKQKEETCQKIKDKK